MFEEPTHEHCKRRRIQLLSRDCIVWWSPSEMEERGGFICLKMDITYIEMTSLTLLSCQFAFLPPHIHPSIHPCIHPSVHLFIFQCLCLCLTCLHVLPASEVMNMLTLLLLRPAPIEPWRGRERDREKEWKSERHKERERNREKQRERHKEKERD